jgi:peptidylprolyl isomerase
MGRNGSESAGREMNVKEGDKVKVHYKGALEDGTVFDSSEGREPLAFEVGTGQVIQGFERGVLGMKEGEVKQLSLPPEEAYGQHRKEMIGKLPMEQVRDPGIKPGSNIQVQTEQGEVIDAKVVQVAEDGVVVDINHPLAGETLIFEVTLVGLERGE